MPFPIDQFPSRANMNIISAIQPLEIGDFRALSIILVAPIITANSLRTVQLDFKHLVGTLVLIIFLEKIRPTEK